MKILTLKVSDSLDSRLETVADGKSSSKSSIVREALEGYLAKEAEVSPESFLALADGLVGSLEAPSDLSVNRIHMKGYGR